MIFFLDGRNSDDEQCREDFGMWNSVLTVSHRRVWKFMGQLRLDRVEACSTPPFFYQVLSDVGSTWASWPAPPYFCNETLELPLLFFLMEEKTAAGMDG